MFYKGMMPKFSFAIAVVVKSRSSSFEYTMSIHAVHAGAEGNVCNIVVPTENFGIYSFIEHDRFNFYVVLNRLLLVPPF